MTAHPELLAHPDYFSKAIVKLEDNVYQAFGFAASNVYMIVGHDGVIIIDTSESTGAAENILAEFRAITTLPIRLIIYTHSHRDHVSGASVFAESDSPEILASEKYSDDFLAVATHHARPTKCMQARTKRQFGIGLKYPEEFIGIGVGPGDRPMKGLGAGSMPPTKKVAEPGESISMCGIDLELVMAPGETPDHMVVWYADKKIMFCGDNYYRSFPNLYAIRGTEYRDFDAWADTMDLLMSFEPEVIAPGHTKALFGAKEIKTVLSDYRDAIRYVVNETRNGMDAGLTMDQLAHSVKLPPELAEKPYLREFYGRVDWSVRAYFVGTMGWFDGNPTSLGTLEPSDEANKFIELLGGTEALIAAIEKAQSAGDFQWALQLVDRLVYSGKETDKANAMKSAILKDHAAAQINCCARHYYLQCSKELAG
ncbi:MAG: alkyl/aryl-sulfatase [Gammaproteobacteria bacterium]|nr:alkyl/aryl-sulfatase [Gammaproteobacteria bacterium]